jgi:16S rRNA A1518/A1519 N6-dimethyltransferase RsmA/KsgA/DIM1 with predicted DNA glycosylase/AP lyase activity
MTTADQILIYIGAGLGLFNLMLPLFKIISKKTATKIDDDIIEILEEALSIARQFHKEAKK